MTNDNNPRRARLEELLTGTHAMSDPTHKRAMAEATPLALALLIDTIETTASVGFGIPGELQVLEGSARVSYLFDEDDVRVALRAHFGEDPTIESIIATLRDKVEGELAAEDALRAEGQRVTDAVHGKGSVFPMTDDPRIDDSIVYNNTGDEPSTHLPVEHMPATDAEPSTDFDEVIGSWTAPEPEAEADPGDPETYETEEEPEEDPLTAFEKGLAMEPARDADEADLAPDSGQASEKPVSGFEKIKKNKKKGKGKE